jgi:prepilin peptidase dependent protein B
MTRQTHLPRSRGLSLVELMVGMAVGLLVVAVALFAITQHLQENRNVLAETRLLQDLRTVTDLLARDLRRAGPLVIDADGVRFTHAGSAEPLAYRLRDGALEMKIGDGAWQAMTDTGTLRVERFRVLPRQQEIALADFCSRPCPAGDDSCPPRQQLRALDLELLAHAVHDPTLSRSTRSTVQLRHDLLIGSCPP